MSHYTQTIMKVTGCNEVDANEVEQMMRNTYSTLDHLSIAKFNKEAKVCYNTVLWMRTPEGIEYMKQLESQYS